ncbi:hypothetical protein LIER_41528 [Lithospermum erythrorhizon]|uniref:Uncharacterized protein n=1 Tax=Lithospermum erythrorhizon TaxID=34254 RepID=A0AAV3RE21_LITER
MKARTSPAPPATPSFGGIIPGDGQGAFECAFIIPCMSNGGRVLRVGVLPPGLSWRFRNRQIPPSGGRDEKAETFAAGLITVPSTNVTEASRRGHVAPETVQLSEKRKRATTKKTTAKVTAPDIGAEGVSKKTKGPRVSQTLEGFRKATSTSAIASSQLRHIRDFYKIETGVKARILFAGEPIVTPMVDPVAAEGDREWLCPSMLGFFELWSPPPLFSVCQ